MAITFHPRPGSLLICDYDTGFKAPEMVKRRPVVVISPRLRRRDGLCSVVPLSTTEPEPMEQHQHRLELKRPLPRPWDSPVMWVKADMLATVGFARLSPIGIGKDRTGKRRYIYPILEPDDLKAIHGCVLHALGLGHLLLKG
jgi:uncharacterized protein YifN (PemK superfamily)